MAQFFDPQGRALGLGKELGSGGEGAVFEIAGDPRRVAKIYHRPVSPEKAEKLRSMAALASGDLTAFASWPLDLLHNGRQAQLAGIVLPRIRDHDEIHKLYSPAHRKLDYPDKDWAFLLHAAMNCAAAFDSIHDKGHVIGDVNQGNVLVSQRGTVFLIDCDSFQVSASGKLFLCEVGVPQYTPPELQGRSFRGVQRTANHDRFGLALLIFHLLLMGRHPFAGRFLGRGDMPIEQAIAEYRYAFSRQAAQSQMAPPPQSLLPDQLAPSLAPLFERAFGRGSERHDARPTAGEWHATLAGLVKELDICSADRGHRYQAAVATCPWCQLMLDGAPNFFLSVTFRATTPDVLNVTPELVALVKAIEAVPRPRTVPLPFLAQAAGNITPTPPPPEVESAESLTRMVKFVAVTSLVAMLAMLVVPEVGYVAVPIFGVFAIWWLAMFLAAGHRPERKRRRRVLRARRGQMKELVRAWPATISRADAQFRLVQKELTLARDKIGKLRGMYDAELHKLGRDVLTRQRDEALKSKFISDYKIDGVGPGRLATLASYGVETAFEVEYNRVLGIPGLDPATTNNLCAWRSGIERGLVLNKSQGVPASERQALLLKYAQVRQQLELKLRQGPKQLRETSAKLQATLDALSTQITAADAAVAQAQADLAIMKVTDTGE